MCSFSPQSKMGGWVVEIKLLSLRDGGLTKNPDFLSLRGLQWCTEYCKKVRILYFHNHLEKSETVPRWRQDWRKTLSLGKGIVPFSSGQ